MMRNLKWWHWMLLIVAASTVHNGVTMATGRVVEGPTLEVQEKQLEVLEAILAELQSRHVVVEDTTGEKMLQQLRWLNATIGERWGVWQPTTGVDE